MTTSLFFLVYLSWFQWEREKLAALLLWTRHTQQDKTLVVKEKRTHNTIHQESLILTQEEKGREEIE